MLIETDDVSSVHNDSEARFHRETVLYSDDNIEVRDTDSGRGFGVYSKRSFRPGEIVHVITGQTIDRNVSNGDEDYSSLYCFFLGVLPNGSSRQLEPGIPGAFFNHSCDPNSQLQSNLSNPFLVAIAYINEGSEITFDYGWTFTDPPQKCLCGSYKCCGYIVTESDHARLKNWIQSHPSESKSLKKIVDRKRLVTGVSRIKSIK